MFSRVVVCLMGPTASGKTDIAIRLSTRFPVELVSVDSALVYRGMDIGTAKPDILTLKKYPHALIDIVDPEVPYSAGKFVRDAEREIDAIAIGRAVAERLKGIDQVAYVRFASVYKQFRDLDDMLDEVRELLESAQPEPLGQGRLF